VETRPDARRDTVLDLVRFGCAMAVLAYHHFFTGPWFHPETSARYRWAGSLTKYGFLGVEVFFIISGFVILTSWQGRSAPDFARARFARLFPAWVVTVAVLGVALLVRDGISGTLLRQVGANLTMLHWLFGVEDLDPVYWTLAVEIRFYTMMVVIGLLARRWLWPIVAGWLAVSLTTPFVDEPAFLYTALDLQWAGLFVAGMVFADVRARGLAWWHLALLGGALVGSYRACRLHADGETFVTGADFPAFALVLVVLFAFTVFALTTAGVFDKVQVRWFTVLGAMTYPVYLVHQELGYIAQGKLDPLPIPLAEGLIVAGVLVYAWLVVRFVEPPLRRRLGPQPAKGLAAQR
jgi:peptidoglycan/LPS O-acetylase OafA/YrhL